MKNNQVNLILVGLFLLCAFSTLWLGQRYNTAYKLEQESETTIVRARNTELMFVQLVGASMELSKKDPALLPLIQAATNPAVPPSNARPAAK